MLDALNDGSALNFTDTAVSSLHGNFSSPWQADARLPASDKENSHWPEKLVEVVGAALTQALTSADPASILTGRDLPGVGQAAATEQGQPQQEELYSQAKRKAEVQAKAVPGITAVVFSDFFKYASGIAVQLLKVRARDTTTTTTTTTIIITKEFDNNIEINNNYDINDCNPIIMISEATDL